MPPAGNVYDGEYARTSAGAINIIFYFLVCISQRGLFTAGQLCKNGFHGEVIYLEIQVYTDTCTRLVLVPAIVVLQR